MRGEIPAGHAEVFTYWEGNRSLSRKGRDYYVEGRKVTIRQAFRWFVRMERKPDGSGNIREQHRFLSAVEKLVK